MNLQVKNKENKLIIKNYILEEKIKERLELNFNNEKSFNIYRSQIKKFFNILNNFYYKKCFNEYDCEFFNADSISKNYLKENQECIFSIDNSLNILVFTKKENVLTIDFFTNIKINEIVTKIPEYSIDLSLQSVLTILDEENNILKDFGYLHNNEILSYDNSFSVEINNENKKIYLSFYQYCIDFYKTTTTLLSPQLTEIYKILEELKVCVDNNKNFTKNFKNIYTNELLEFVYKNNKITIFYSKNSDLCYKRFQTTFAEISYDFLNVLLQKLN